MSLSSTLAALLVLGIAAYKVIVYPAFLSPLSKVPTAHWSCSFSSAWLLLQKWTQRENRSVYNRHLRSGSVIRLAPNALSVNCFEDGLKTIYQGGFPKPDFYFKVSLCTGMYLTFRFTHRRSSRVSQTLFPLTRYPSTDNIFTFRDNEAHRARKKLISNIFSKSFIMKSPTARSAIRDALDHYLQFIRQAAHTGQLVEVLELNYAYSMDSFTQWQFGKRLASNFIQDQKERKTYLDAWFGLAGCTFWLIEFPVLANILRKVGIFLVPKWVDIAFGNSENWNLEKCDQAQQLLASGEKLGSDDQPIVFAQAMEVMSNINSKPRSYPQRLEIAGDMFTHSSAAFETSGNTMSYLMFELCQNPSWQKRLREELLTLEPQLDLLQPKEIDDLPVLHALFLETLRLHPPVPGGQPRVVPEPCTLGGYHNIPAGTYHGNVR